MPELPDVTLYVDALKSRIVGQRLDALSVNTPFLLRTFDPPIQAVAGKRGLGVHRIGKRIATALEDDLYVVLHLMIAGRLHWSNKPATEAKVPRSAIALWEFSGGTLWLTEAGTKKRASLHIVRGVESLKQF